MRRVILVRHAHHDRLGHVLCGRMPGVSLSEHGRDQARALALRLGGTAASQILSSPRDRTLETAGPLAQALGPTVQTADELDEIDFGEWTGSPVQSLEGDPRWSAWNTVRARSRAPGGESMAEAQARVSGLLKRLGTEEAPPAFLVSHGDIIRAALLHLLGLSLDAYDRIVVEPASWSEVVLWPGGGRVVSLNERVAL